MTRSIRSAALYSVSLACLLLSACGKHTPAPPAGSPAAASTAATAPTAAKSTVTTISKTATTIPTAPAVASTTTHTTVVTAPASTALSVATVTLGNAVNAAHQVTQAGNHFAASDKTIYASVATTGNSDGATLNAKWSYLEGQGQLISSISQAIATDGPAVTTFMVQNPDLWPEGTYKIEISLDGKPVTTKNFEISKH
jgi:hypothetical protein